MTEQRKKPQGRAKQAKQKPRQRVGKPLNVWLQAELRDSLDTMLQRTRRSLTAEVSLALEEYLARNGFWPPPASPSTTPTADK